MSHEGRGASTTTTSSSGSAARQWSSEIVCVDHKDIQATAMGLSTCGRLALLGGRRCLALVTLEQEEGLRPLGTLP
jgi:hypothetical protein